MSASPSPHGSWPTPITSELVVRAAAGIGGVHLDGDVVTWSESRPEEGGRIQLVRKMGDGPAVDLLPADFNARSAVHEYGGGAWWGRGPHSVHFVNWADQRIHRLTGKAMPLPITPEPATPRGDRWADGDVDSEGRWLVVVREHHPEGGGPDDVRNEVVVVDLEGAHEPRVLVTGPDFVSDPRISPDRSRLCWLQWSHPDMPWDGTELVVAGLRWSDIGPGISAPGGRGRRARRRARRARGGGVGHRAPLGARRVPVVHLRPHRLVEPAPLGAAVWLRARLGGGDGADGG